MTEWQLNHQVLSPKPETTNIYNKKQEETERKEMFKKKGISTLGFANWFSSTSSFSSSIPIWSKFDKILRDLSAAMKNKKINIQVHIYVHDAYVCARYQHQNEHRERVRKWDRDRDL